MARFFGRRHLAGVATPQVLGEFDSGFDTGGDGCPTILLGLEGSRAAGRLVAAGVAGRHRDAAPARLVLVGPAHHRRLSAALRLTALPRACRAVARPV